MCDIETIWICMENYNCGCDGYDEGDDLNNTMYCQIDAKE